MAGSNERANAPGVLADHLAELGSINRQAGALFARFGPTTQASRAAAVVREAWSRL